LIIPIVRTALMSLRRDRAALALSFALPIAFFSIFAAIFGGQHNSTSVSYTHLDVYKRQPAPSEMPDLQL